MAILPCVKAEKRRGEEIRRALKELELLRTDARIISNDDFIYLPLIRALKEAEKREIGAAELLTREFEVLERRRSIEDIVGLKPSYEIIGDVAVLTDALNETNEQLIAHAILNLHKNIKVVAKRISPVEGVFRKRKMKIIAGEDRIETMHKENGCKYKLDLEKVYFNPRLASERNRVAAQVRGNKEEIIDMFAGVGSFAIQLAKRARQSHVTAIDVNPDAIRYLRENIRLNGVKNVEAMEGDVREIYVKFRNKADRIIMNLPKSAYSFIREALSMLNPQGGIIHFYDVESSYSDVSGEKRKSLETAINKAKERLAAKVKEACEQEEFHFQLEIQEARKVKPYAPYAYIIGVDAMVKK
ncbi:MAG: class I SAM-dependent methyltransferase family protein [Methanomicrobia archaeon]|nr:class I SAM-dependent methyltransferase family protein [Methanomicrobia archaeon]